MASEGTGADVSFSLTTLLRDSLFPPSSDSSKLGWGSAGAGPFFLPEPTLCGLKAPETIVSMSLSAAAAVGLVSANRSYHQSLSAIICTDDASCCCGSGIFKQTIVSMSSSAVGTPAVVALVFANRP